MLCLLQHTGKDFLVSEDKTFVAIDLSSDLCCAAFYCFRRGFYAGAHGAQLIVACGVQAGGQEPCTSSASLHGAPYTKVGIASGVLQSLGLH